ncbi:MAG: hypothetical protein FWF86_00245 [Clostridia bacterium]|nr:hypothetical protein [Clostridia bacterium]
MREKQAKTGPKGTPNSGGAGAEADSALSGRLWVRLMTGHRCLREAVLPCGREDPREALRRALPELDVSQPLWLPIHQADWAEYALARFLPEHFVDSVPFDRMEISYIAPPEEARPVRKRNPLWDA